MNALLERATELTGQVSGLLWGSPLTLIALLGTGVYLTVRLGFVQLRGFLEGWRLLFTGHRDPQGQGEIPGWRALSASLSATVGTGNIAGVATAISLGGPGALFWMWLTALVGMATRFAECTLAQRFRRVYPDGEVAGGPMYTLANGLGMRRTAITFSLFAVIASFGIGNMVQANSVIDGLGYLQPKLKERPWLPGLIITACLGLVVVGGIRRIAAAAGILVPAMFALYMGGALVILLRHATEFPAALSMIANHAFNPQAAGAAAVGEAIRWGVARGLFSNEAGLGSSPMAIAAGRFRHPVQGGLLAMLGPFIDTIVICSLTGFAILLSGSLETRAADQVGAALTAHAFHLEFGRAGGWIVGGGLTLFAFSTMITWCYYGDRSASFLFGRRAVLPYRLAFTALAFVGSVVSLHLVWAIADITNLLMALPNLVSLWLLAGVTKQLHDEYFRPDGKPPS